MPYLSVLVPCYRVEEYLDECLDSILVEGGARDLEVIAIDDASPDATGEILDRRAAADERLRVLHLDRNVGLGEARNRALEQARGTYVLFCDSDDRYADGALEAIERRLRRTTPEMLIFGHADLLPDGSTRRTRRDLLLSRLAVADTFVVRERPEVLQLIPAAWTRAFQRGFLLREDLRFPSTHYEEVGVTYRSLFLAGRISVLDERCYLYRQRATGSITRTPSRDHFAIFERYAEAFAVLESRPDLADLRGPLLEAAVRHELHVLDSPRRIPEEDRERFFAEVVAQHRRHRPKWWRPPLTAVGLKHLLVATGSFPLYETLRRVKDARR